MKEPMKNHLDSNEKIDLSNKSSEIDDIRQKIQDLLLNSINSPNPPPLTNKYKVVENQYLVERFKNDPQSVESLFSNIKERGLKAINYIEVSLDHNQNKYPGQYVGEFKSYNKVKGHLDYFKVTIEKDETFEKDETLKFISAHKDEMNNK